MKTTTLIANRNLYYDRDIKAGEEFEVREEHVDLLVRFESAKIKEDKSKRHYNRRDMRAEESKD